MPTGAPVTKRRRLSRLAAVTTVLGALAAASLVPVAGVAAASPAAVAEGATGVVELNVPAGVRSDPRVVHLKADTTDGVVMDREVDVTYARSGYAERVLAQPDGTFSSTPATTWASVIAVLADSVVTKDGTTVTRTYLAEGQLSSTVDTVTLPQNFWVLGYSDRGVLGAHTEDQWNPVLGLLPWDGGDEVPVTGLPAGHQIYNGDAAHDANGQVLGAAPAGQTHRYFYVDFAAAHVTRMPLLSTPGDSPCTSAGTSTWGMNDGHVAWLPFADTGGGGTGAASVYCDWSVPTATNADGGPVRSRDATRSNDYLSGRNILPVGDDIVVSGNGAQKASANLPVYAVASDGTTRKVVGWGHDVIASTPGHFLVVGGDTAADVQVRRVALDGTSTVAVPVTPVASTVDAVAVDDSRLSFVDDSKPGFGVVTRAVPNDGTIDLGTPTVIDAETDPSTTHGNVVAGDGSVAWSSAGDYSSRWAVRDPQGVVHRGTGGYGQVSAVSGPWILLDRKTLVDTRTGKPTDVSNDGADLLDGVLYLPGFSAGAARKDVVVARDLVTLRNDVIPVPGCTTVYTVRVAGSWMLADCSTPTGSTTVVMDRTGTTPSWSMPASGWKLGNGFLAGRTTNGEVQWRPLADPSAGWSVLGSSTATVDEVTYYDRVAVSRGQDPLVAWAQQRSVRLVRLPVGTSPLPAHPTGPALTAPAVTADPTNSYVTLTWAKPAAEENVTGYEVRYSGSRFPSSFGPDVQSASFSGLTNGSSYAFTVTAFSAVGKVSTTLLATPIAPPQAPWTVQVNVTPDRSAATVSWSWAATANSEPLQDFSVSVGGQRVATGIPGDRRSVTFPLTESMSGRVDVHANGPHQSSSGWGPSLPAATTDPAPSNPSTPPDVTAPTAALTALPAVLLTSTVGVTLTANDDRQLDPNGPLEMRWRSAAVGGTFGAWSAPSIWQRLGAGKVNVTGLAKGRTYCFSTRARDTAGNTSGWTAAMCTTTALDQTSLTRSTGWATARSSRYYGGTAATSTRTGATLRRTVRTDAAWVVATACPTCGKLGVYLGPTRLTTLNLKSSTRADRRVFTIPLGTRRTGTLTLRPATAGRTTSVDGIALRSY